MLHDLEALPLDIDIDPLNWDFEDTEKFIPSELEIINSTIEYIDYEIDPETLQEVGKAIESIEMKDDYQY